MYVIYAYYVFLKTVQTKMEQLRAWTNWLLLLSEQQGLWISLSKKPDQQKLVHVFSEETRPQSFFFSFLFFFFLGGGGRIKDDEHFWRNPINGYNSFFRGSSINRNTLPFFFFFFKRNSTDEDTLPFRRNVTNRGALLFKRNSINETTLLFQINNINGDIVLFRRSPIIGDDTPSPTKPSQRRL